MSRRRMPSGVAAGFLHVMPDLVVEIRSPDDSQRRLADKVGEYLDAGVALAWTIDPGARRASVHRSISDVVTIGEDGFLDGEAALPGFRCRLGDVLP